MLERANPRMHLIKPQIQSAHFSLLTQIANNCEIKYAEAFDDILHYPFCRGSIEGLSSVCKAVTENLDSIVGDFYRESYEEPNFCY